MMNQKDLKFMGVVALATIVLSALLNMLVLKLAEDKIPGDGTLTVKELKKEYQVNQVDTLGVGDELMYMSAVDGAFWLSNSLMMAVYVCLGVVAGQQAVKAKLI